MNPAIRSNWCCALTARSCRSRQPRRPKSWQVARCTLPRCPENMLRRTARQLTSRIMASQKLRPTSLVIEIASNDGYLLRNYLAAGIPVLGIEPAANVADVARREHRVPTLCRSFNGQLAAELAGCSQLADVVHVHNVLACAASHPNDFVAGLRTLLQDTGVAVINAPM